VVQLQELQINLLKKLIKTGTLAILKIRGDNRAIDLLPGILCNVVSKINDCNYTPGDTEAPTAPTNLIASNITQNSLTLTWTASTDNIAVVAYEVYQGSTLLNGNVATTNYNVTGLTCNTTYNFTVKARDAAGNVSTTSDTATATTVSCPVITNQCNIMMI
jgi:hypothetical protein